MFMSFFGNLADTFGLNFKKNNERKKLRTLAKNMTNLCNSEFFKNFDRKSYKKIYEIIKSYIWCSQALYELVEKLCSKRNESSNFKNKVDSLGILNGFPLEGTKIDYDNSADYISFFAENDDLPKKLKKNQEWLKKFENIDNKFYSVWTKSIKEAVSTLSDIDMSEILTDNISVLKRSNSLIIKNNNLKIDKVKTSDKLQRNRTSKSNYEVKIDELISRIDEFLNKRKNQSYEVSDAGKKAIFDNIFEYHFIVKDLYTLLKQSKNPTLKSKFSDIEKSFDFGRNLSFMDTTSSCLNFKEQENKHIQEPIGKFLQKNNNYKTMEEALEEYRSWLENVADIDLNNSSAWPDKLRLRVQKLSETMMGLELTAALQGKRAWVPIKDRKGYKFSS